MSCENKNTSRKNRFDIDKINDADLVETAMENGKGWKAAKAHQ